MRLPPAVRAGARIGVAALSGPVDPERLRRGLTVLRGLGFEPVPADNLAARHGLFAGDDRSRLAAFYRLTDDPSVEAVIFARGGYGIMRLLPDLDWDRLARHPRAYVGYSDLTPFLHEVTRRLGLVAFHGPMVAADMARGLRGEEAASLLAALAGDYPRCFPVRCGGASPGEPVSGPLLGGCLSLVAALSGTPWAPDLRGSLFFWEDVDEPLYRLDRMLTHLRLSGSLAAIRAMILGHVEPVDGTGEVAGGSASADPAGAPVWLRTLREGWTGEVPLVWGLEAGHRAPNLTLPLGLTARLEPSSDCLVCGDG